MRRATLVLTIFFVVAFKSGLSQTAAPKQNNPQLATLVNSYYEENLKLNPVDATFNGDNRYNDLLYIDFTDGFRASSQQVYQRFLGALSNFNRESLSDKDKLDFDVLKWELELNNERMTHKSNLIPFTQLTGGPQVLSLLGSGNLAQPFKTVQDYDNWLKRASVFPAWADSAIVYFRKGMAQNFVLPKTVVVKMIPQLAAMVMADPAKSPFYGPVAKMPSDFSKADQMRLKEGYTKLITDRLFPAYQKLHDFLKNEYLPKAAASSGFGALPGGGKLYAFLVRRYTTTNKTPDEIFNIGLAEVARIQGEMQKIKNEVGFAGDLKSFFEHMRTDPKFYPYKTSEEILKYYRSIQQRMEPALKVMFNQEPRTPFEVREIEAFRAAATPAHYFRGSIEAGRPGIFYVPIIDPAKTQARESLFLHEAIPGHHYQLSLQNEDTTLSKFRRFGGNSAYIEGWGLYAESLGKELGVYTDPYQHILALGDEIHRAIRLVVDAGIHSKGWTREQAIQYSLDNEPIEEQRAVSEIERYMANPGQALAYKIGELKLKELRAKYSRQLGSHFDLALFHDEILRDGTLPLEVLEQKMDAWAAQQKINGGKRTTK